MLSPLSGAGGPPLIQQNASEAEIFYNATGFLRCVGAGEAWQSQVPGGVGCLQQLGLNDKVELAKGLGEVDSG